MKKRWQVAQYFEALWWRFYLGRKDMANYLQWKEKYWRNFLINNNIAVTTKEKILDVGCGPMGVFSVFPDHQVVAVDPLFGTYRRQFPHLQPGSYPNVRFVELALEQYEPPHGFDLVFCINAINHVADLAVCLKKLAACTRPGGRLILTVDAHNYLIFKRLFRLVPGDILHPHQHDLVEYTAMLAKAGFEAKAQKRLRHEFFFDYYLLDCINTGA